MKHINAAPVPTTDKIERRNLIQTGLKYYYGRRGVEQNYEEAVKYFKAADCQSRLGKCYLYGHGVEQNYEEAVKCFIASDDRDMLGECYLRGFGVERNPEKTVELWESACEEQTRYYCLMFKLAHLYGDGIEIEPNYEKASDWWYQLSENDEGDFGEGFAEALYRLAYCYYEGKGVKKSLKSALKFFKRTIDLFYEKINDSVYYVSEYDRERCVINVRSYNIEGNMSISDEPDFIIDARKVLAKHGYKSVINKLKKAALSGDRKAEEILNELGIEHLIPEKPASVAEEPVEEVFCAEESERTPPTPLNVGEAVTHTSFGEGVICNTDGAVITVDFPSIGKKKFLNPEAFDKGYLKLARLI